MVISGYYMLRNVDNIFTVTILIVQVAIRLTFTDDIYLTFERTKFLCMITKRKMTMLNIPNYSHAIELGLCCLPE